MTGKALSRRSFLRGLGASAVGLGLTGCGPEDDDLPDIVVLVLDSMRARSLPMYGYPLDTAPFLADLATRSTLYERCYSAATWTRPSVTSILTGLPPLGHRGWRFDQAFPADRPSFVRALGEVGYRTGFFTANPAIGKRFGMEKHFDHVSTTAAEKNDVGPRLTDDCMAWMKHVNHSRPVFVYIHYLPPHGPYAPPDEFLQRALTLPPQSTRQLAHCYRDRAGISLASGILGKIPWYQAKVNLATDPAQYRQRYDANIAFADSLAEGFFSGWEGLRTKRRTVIIVTGDHGESLGEHDLLFDHGMILTDEILHVPLLVHDTAQPRPARIGRPVSHLDLAPTILELAETPQSFGSMGASLFRERPEERIIVSQEGVERGESGWALTSGRWRLVYNGGARFGGRRLMHVHAADKAAAKVTATAAAFPATAIRYPHELGKGMILESFAFHDQTLTRGAKVSFSGTLRTSDEAERLALRARVPGSPPADLGVFPTGDFEGEMSDMPDGKARHLILEGARQTASSAHQQGRDWQRLLTAPILDPNPVTEALELSGSVMDPGTACPGDSVRITLHWRAHRNLARRIGCLVELVDRKGEVAIREARTFFSPLTNEKPKPQPLIEEWNLRETTFSHGSLDFEDTFWWTLPSGLDPGIFRLRVGLLDYEKYSQTKQVVSLADPVPSASLEVAETRSACLHLHHRRELGIESLRLPPGSQPSAADRPVLEALARRFPREGHLAYLLATIAQTRSEKRELLVRCIDATPFHCAALAELASLGDEASAETLKQLTPSHPRTVRFGDLVRLSGFDLSRGDSCLYLTLYWEAEAVSAALFSTKLAATMRRNTGESAQRWMWWFIGGAQRPTDSWKIGECVTETIRVEVEPETTKVSLKLALAERWRVLASDSRGRFTVTKGNGEEAETTRADLGTHRLDRLPRCETDYLALKRSDPDQCVLFDLDEDPDQRRDLTRERPEVFARLHRQLGALLTASASWGDRREGAEVELTPEEIEQLKALGYLE